MKPTNKKPFSCEQLKADAASSAQLKYEQRYARQVSLVRRRVSDRKQEAADKRADDAAFWKGIYILTHVVGILIVLITMFWGQ